MNNQTSNLRSKILNSGEAACRILSGTQHGTVLASITDVLYMQSDTNELFWLIPTSNPMHQRALQVASPLPRLSAGIRYDVVDHHLIISSDNKFDFQDSPIWRSILIPREDFLPLSRLSESLHSFIEHLLARNSPTGFGILIKPILEMTVNRMTRPETNLSNRLTGKAWSAIEGIIQASLEKNADHIMCQAKSLVGFGEGLTPSGDDFLGGFFFSWQFISRYYPNKLNIFPCNYSDFMLQSYPLTNLISYFMLKDNTDGHSIEPMHQFANGLLRGEPVDQLLMHAEKVISLGHSTGWDLLTGFIAGMSVSAAQ